MKHCFVFLLLFLFSAAGAKAAALTPQDIIFTPRPGGKFIYCNNPEAITNEWLADTSNKKPKYLMNNEDLGPDVYCIYVSHINHTGPRENYKLLDKGFDIEVDVAFIAKEDTELVIRKTAFETPQIKRYYKDGAILPIEDNYGSLNACAEMLGHDIRELNSDVTYHTKEQKPVTLQVKKGEIFWLSELIENYRPVAFRKTVHLAAEAEILSGKMDINVAAIRSSAGRPGNRSYVAAKPGYGDYIRDRMHKGVADNLPIVDTSLAYTIDDSHTEGTHLPVMVYNQYVPEGYQATEWCTHLNPQDDAQFRRVAVESDLMSYHYRDDTKLNYYGANVPQQDRDNIYRFDAFHSDTIGYDGLVTGYQPEDYLPNYPLSTELENFGYCCSIGNYGVETKYHMSIENAGSYTRYLKYNMTTSSNAIVMVEDKAGNLLQPVISRGQTPALTMETVACVELPAQATTEFVITVILPVNQFGGLRNSMHISDRPYTFQFETDQRLLVPENVIISDIDELLTHSDKATQKAFAGNAHNYIITKTKTGYMARWSPWDGFPDYYRPYLALASGIYFLDEDFNLTHTQLFPAQPVEASYAKGMYFVRTEGDVSYRSTDGKTWLPYGEKQLPKDNGSTYAAVMANGTEYLTLNADNFFRVDYQAAPPLYIESIGDLYYYAIGEKIFISFDGVYWQEYDAGILIQSVERRADQLIINGEKSLTVEKPQQNIIVRLDNAILGFDQPPVISNDRVMVPFRFIFEKLGMYVTWDPETQTATAFNGVRTLSFPVGSPTALVDGTEYPLDAPAIQTQDRVLVPLRFLSEKLGYDVQWDAVNQIARIISKP